MAKQSAYPPALDSLATDLAATDVLSASVWNTYMDGIYFLEDTVGITGSAVTHSMDYKTKTALNPGHKHTSLATNEWNTASPIVSGGSSQQNMVFGGSLAYTWPAAQATTGAYLANDGSGNLSWGGKLRARIYFTTGHNAAAADYSLCHLDTVDFDSGGICEVATNHKITPGIAGYYLVIFVTEVAAVADTEVTRAALYVNGAVASRGSQVTSGISTIQRSTGMDLVYLDADDYIQLYVWNSDTANAMGTGKDATSLTLFGPL